MLDDYPYTWEEMELKSGVVFIFMFWNVLALLCMFLGVIFLNLKIFNIINWSWWLIFLPIYGFLGITIIIIATILGLSLLFEWIENIKDRKK